MRTRASNRAPWAKRTAPRRAALASVLVSTLSVATSVGVTVGGCDLDNGGVDPVPGTLNFPVAIAVTPDTAGRQFLLVANSNFDLRYNSGSLQSFDLAGMRAAIAGCTDAPCAFEDLSSYLVSEVLIGSYTSDLAISPRGNRVYLSVRSEVDLSWIDLDPATGDLACEGEGQPQTCADRRRTTEIASTCGRDLVISGDPVGIVAGRVGDLTGESSDLDYVVMVHRNGRASLFLDRQVGGAPEPVLVHTTDGLPRDIINVSFEPSSQLIWTHTASLVGTRQSRDIGFAGVAYDATNPECSSVFSAGRLPLLGIDDGYDTRDSVFSPDGSHAYVLSRRPEAILTLDLEGSPLFPGQAAIDRVSFVGYAPSRMARVDIADRTVLAATCFDDRKVWFVDAETGVTAGTVPGFQGPYELAIDDAAQLAWIVDFRDSVIRAIDFSPLASGNEPRLVATFGRVRPVQVLR